MFIKGTAFDALDPPIVDSLLDGDTLNRIGVGHPVHKPLLGLLQSPEAFCVRDIVGIGGNMIDLTVFR